LVDTREFGAKMSEWINPRHKRIDKIIQGVRSELDKFDKYNSENKYIYFNYLERLRTLLWVEEKTIDCCEMCTGDVATPQRATVCDVCYREVVEDNSWFFEQYFEQKERISELEAQLEKHKSLEENNYDQR
jgi:hypothetical protein